eukprot:4401949-Amphidinium_carterae.1
MPTRTIFPARRWNKLVVLKVLYYKAHGFESELEEWSFYLKAANHFEELERDVASHAASHPKWISRAKLSWRKKNQGGGVHAVLEREVPGPACPLMRKRRHVMLS